MAQHHLHKPEGVHVKHVTYEDGMPAASAETILKTWIVKNIGDTRWPTGITVSPFYFYCMGSPCVAE